MTVQRKPAAIEWSVLREKVALALWIHHGIMLGEFRTQRDWSVQPYKVKHDMRRRARSHISRMRALGVSIEIDLQKLRE